MSTEIVDIEKFESHKIAGKMRCVLCGDEYCQYISVTWNARKRRILTVDHHETLQTARYGIDDLNTIMGYCVQVRPDSRIVSRSTQFLDKVVLFGKGP